MRIVSHRASWKFPIQSKANFERSVKQKLLISNGFTSLIRLQLQLLMWIQYFLKQLLLNVHLYFNLVNGFRFDGMKYRLWQLETGSHSFSYWPLRAIEIAIWRKFIINFYSCIDWCHRDRFDRWAVEICHSNGVRKRNLRSYSMPHQWFWFERSLSAAFHI